MGDFAIKRLPAVPDVVAPDGSDVRVLLALSRGSMAHFTLTPGRTSIAVAHRTVEEIWYVLGGRGEMWRRLGDHEEVVALDAGVCLTIPAGTHFQFRALGKSGDSDHGGDSGNLPLTAIGVTMPPWPGEDEAYRVPGHWPPSSE